ncbi:MAG: 3-phosphoshikimate 1-carboxyvinyltransferase [Bacteroidia bacterium]
MAELSLPEGPLPILKGEVEVPGSKSISNRILIMNYLAGDALTSIHGLSTAADTVRMQSVLNALKEPSSDGEVRVGDAGTVMRFVLPLLCLTPGTHRMTGAERAHERPIGPLVDALRLLGAQIQYLEREGCLPLKIEGGSTLQMPLGIEALPIDASMSSQFVSALLLVAPYLQGGLRLRLSAHTASRPYLHLTIELMRLWGIHVEVFGERDISIIPSRYHPPARVEVEPDWSSAAYWLAWAALMPQTALFVPRLKPMSLQADAVCVGAFAELGVQTIEVDGGLLLHHCPSVHYSGHAASHFALDFSGFDTPDLMPTAMVLCALKNKVARFTGLETLRVKESDRLGGLIQGLRSAGAWIEERERGAYWLTRGIPPATIRGQVFHCNTQGDHRMAMAFSLLASHGYGVHPDRPEVVGKSYPSYWRELERLGMRWRP